MGTEERLREAAPAAFEGEAVAFAYLFGSRATGRTHPGSDVDVAVMLEERVPASEYLEARLRLAQKLADASRAGDVEVVVLNEAPLPLAGRVVRDGKVLYSRDEPARCRYESLTFRMFADFRYHADQIDRALLRAIAEGRR